DLLPSSEVIRTGPDTAPVINPLPDGMEGFNRSASGLNHGLYLAFMRPLAIGWGAITPQGLRDCIRNMAYNISFPVRFFGTLLQGELGASGEEIVRFILNSTIGIAGLFDPASGIGMPKHDEDFGQAFGAWGIPPGGYFVWPLLGQDSDGRDF